jgi:hypothetical protein
VRGLRRSGGVPDPVLRRAGLPRGERALAYTEAADGTWLLGTRSMLVVVGPEEVSRIPWEQVQDAAWDQDAGRLTVSEVGTYGAPRPSYVFDLDDPALLLQLVRERVTASIVLQRRVPVRGRQGVTVIGRRSPGGGEVRWMHAYDAGLDPEDPEVVVVAELALQQARAEVGNPMYHRPAELLVFAGAIPCSSIGRAFDC